MNKPDVLVLLQEGVYMEEEPGMEELFWKEVEGEV